MAKEIAQDLNLVGGAKIINLILEGLATAPPNPSFGQIYIDSTTKFAFVYNGTAWVAFAFNNIISVLANGSVGIGQPSPVAKLDVRADALGVAIASKSMIAKFGSLVINDSFLKIFNNRYAAGSDWTTASLKLQAVVDSTDMGYVEFNPQGAAYGLALGTYLGEALRILNNGNVGIGTTNPIAKLHVAGDAKILNNLSASNYTFGDGQYIRNENVVDGNGVLYLDVSNLRIRRADNGTTLMPVLSTGFVGIGTITPAAKLDVNGDIFATLLKLTGLAGAVTGNRQLAVSPTGQLVANTATKINVYTANATWTKPDTCIAIDVLLISAGGGGGSGRKGAASTVRCAGGGGGGGGYAFEKFTNLSLLSVVAITVGVGGVGGVAISANSTNGNSGASGGTSSFGSYLSVSGGTGGGGGTVSTGNAGQVGTGYSNGTLGGASSTSGIPTAGGNSTSTSAQGATGGGAGGGIPAANTTNAGAAGGGKVIVQVLSGGAAGAAGAAGGNGNDSAIGKTGTGGGGGGASLTGNAADGGAGGNYGGGGGGGGASVDSVGNSGAGGKGADGIVVVIEYY